MSSLIIFLSDDNLSSNQCNLLNLFLVSFKIINLS